MHDADILSVSSTSTRSFHKSTVVYIFLYRGIRCGSWFAVCHLFTSTAPTVVPLWNQSIICCQRDPHFDKLEVHYHFIETTFQETSTQIIPNLCLFDSMCKHASWRQLSAIIHITSIQSTSAEKLEKKSRLTICCYIPNSWVDNACWSRLLANIGFLIPNPPFTVSTLGIGICVDKKVLILSIKNTDQWCFSNKKKTAANFCCDIG